MSAGVQMAQTFDYQLGIALTPAQMAMLTSDIVWLVQQKVTLADGSSQEVLVPQVYLRAKRLQVTGEGTLIAGARVNYQTSGAILNNGTIAAKQTVILAGDHIDNPGGRISGADTLLQAQTDINNLGGRIDGSHSVTLQAERDINITSSSVLSANATTIGANIESVASIGSAGLLWTASASGARGTADGSDVTWTNTHVDAGEKISMTLGSDTTLKGAVVSAPQITADVGGDLHIASLQDTSRFDSKQQSIGGSISVGQGRMSGSLSVGKSNTDSDYASVQEQSGLRAGDLKASMSLSRTILTSKAARSPARKKPSTTTKTVSRPVVNSPRTTSRTRPATQPAASASTLAQARVSTANSRRKAPVRGLAQIAAMQAAPRRQPSAVWLETKTLARVMLRAAFKKSSTPTRCRKTSMRRCRSRRNSDAPRAGWSVITRKAKERICRNDSKWSEGGVYRVALHTTIDALSGGAVEAVRAGTVAAAASALNDMQGRIAKGLEDAGANATVAKAATQLITGTAAAGI
jgi:adhesin HecA-like repeat protein